MIEPLPPAISVGDLTLLKFIGDNPTQKSEQIPESFLQLEEFLDPSLDAIPGSSPLKKSPGSELDELNDEEEEELEWLSNKDAFPPLETSFEVRKSTAVLLAPNFKAPVRARSKVGRKKRRIFGRVGEERRRCRHCEAEETPQWRVGPEGPKTLCNACGVRFRKGRLFPEYRPVNSPTFLAELHSSSHRRVIGVRKKRGRPRKRMIIL